MPGWRTAWTTAAVVVLASILSAPLPPAPPASRPLEAPADGYVGSARCRACHPAEHASWHDSYHRTMSQVATRAALAVDFERLELDWFGVPVVLEWRGDTLWTRFARGGARPAPVERPVEQLTGSHHLQVLWYSTGRDRELAPVPMGYHVAERVWLPLTTVFVLPPEYRDPPEPGAWSHSCVNCHTTQPRPRLDGTSVDTHVGELGIACEACHGPGERHVAANRDPLARWANHAAGTDATIVDPAKRPPARSAQVCGHCHAVSIVREAHFASWADTGSPFRPGADLHATHLVIGANDGDAPELRRELQRNPAFFASAFWPDGEVRLSGREYNGLRQSPCYTHGDTAKQMDCSSCHRMHPPAGAHGADWRDDQLRDGMRGNAACTQCHERLAEPEQLQAHTHHAPASPGSACMDCHMPHTAFGLMKASRSHRVTSPSVQVELATGRPNACNLCHLDRTLAWTAEHLERGWGVAAPALDDEQRTVAAGARWLLTGDAAVRAIAAWSFGWQRAHATAGTDWLAPYLARLLDDPYYVVRFGAARSLRALPGGEPALAGYDFLAETGAAREFGDAVRQRWTNGWRGAPRAAVLVDERGLRVEPFDRLYARRDDRPVFIAE
jgi:hypothetical protein